MFCKNCGKEIEEKSTHCKFCGCDFSVPLTVNAVMKTKKTKSTIGFCALCIAILLGVFIIISNSPKTPKIDQLKSDFTTELFGEKEYTLTGFAIASETDGKESPYKAIVNVVYDNKKIQHQQQYEFFYNKYNDEWVLDKIEEREKDNWSNKIIAEPLISDYVEIFNQYDVVKPIPEKTIIDLDTGKARFTYHLENTAPIISGSQECSILCNFNYSLEDWKYDSCTDPDNITLTTNYLQKWSGECSSQADLIWIRSNPKAFVFEIVDATQDEAKAILSFDNKKYTLTGTITPSEAYGPFDLLGTVNLDFKDKANGVCVSGSLHYNGNLAAVIHTVHRNGYDPLNANIYKPNMELISD